MMVSKLELRSDPSARRALVVAGMHRSGTSAMARVLSLLGAVLPKRLMEAHPDNPVGFWESEKVVQFNDEILQALDSDWDDVFSFVPRPYLSNFDRVFIGRAVELLQEEFDGAELIAFKDPRVSVLTAFWERALREAGYVTNYIIMARNPLEVAESLRSRNNFPREKSLLLWSSYMTAVERDTRQLSRTFVSYDELMRDWRRVRSRIQEGTGIPFPRNTAAAANDIDRFLDRGLRHHQTTTEDLISRVDVPDYVKTLYRVILDACEGSPIDEAAIEAVNAELSTIETSVGSLVADLRAKTRNLENEIAEARKAQLTSDGRVSALSDELTATREQRQLDIEAASRLKAEHNRQLTELRGRITESEVALEKEKAATRDAHEALMQAIRDRTRSEGLLNERIGTLAAELRQKEAAVAQAQAKLAEQANSEARLTARIAELSEELRKKDAAAVEAETKLAEQAREEKRLSGRISELSQELRQKETVVREAEKALDVSRAEKRSTDAQLEARFGELASLTRMLAESETREEKTRSDAEWLRDTSSMLLNGSSSLKGRLLALLPAAVVAKRRRRLLKEMGLFDAEAYLAANPDVAAEGTDPLVHYLKHGISEDRRRR